MGCAAPSATGRDLWGPRKGVVCLIDPALLMWDGMFDEIHDLCLHFFGVLLGFCCCWKDGRALYRCLVLRLYRYPLGWLERVARTIILRSD